MAIISATLLPLLQHVLLSAAQHTSSQPPIFQHTTLNFSSASPHIFASTFGLLQQWSNTFYPFGHNIVPCEVPINTNLYHARINGELPPSPEWFAFDAAMSYAIAGTISTSRLLTYRTTRTVKCIYFDGTSAALNEDGNMDSQMVLIHNNSANVPENPTFGPGKPNNRTSGDPNGPMLGAEYDRAEALCAFIRDAKLGGRGWGYEGIVRMNAGFEMIWCDFESPSVRLVSQLNSSVPSYMNEAVQPPSIESLDRQVLSSLDSRQKPLDEHDRRPGTPPPQRRGSREGSTLGWLTASANQYGFVGGMPGRGEVRVKARSCGTWSFYDAGLADQEHARVIEESKMFNLTSSGEWISPANETERANTLQKLQRRRRSHRANHISKPDGTYMRNAVEQRLRMYVDPHSNDCSGIDWHQIAEQVLLEYSTPLQDLLGLMKNKPSGLESNHTQAQEWLGPVRELSHLFTMPYYEYPLYSYIKSSPERAFRLDTPNAQDAYARCRDKYLPLSSGGVAESEQSTYAATVDVLESICGVILTMFLAIETIWYTNYDEPSSTSMDRHIDKAADTWRKDVEELMAWLGWADQWTSCNPGCGPSELCWIPMWPLSFMARSEQAMDESDERKQDMSSLEERPPPPPEGHGPPRYGGPYGGGPGRGGPGHGYPGLPPGFGRGSETLLWEPHCVDRTQILSHMI